MFKKGMRILLAAAAVAPLLASSAWAAGLMTIIVNDPSNPYWLTEGNVAKATAEKLGYTASVSAHKGDTNTESNLIDTAITNKSFAIILDPANADGSIGAVKKAVAAGIPVILVNAEINQEGLAKAQLVSNNAQGAALGAQQWVESVGDKGNYAELFGAPSDNNAATRSNGYETVLSQYPDLKKVAQEVANWDRTQGHNKMQSMLQAHPDIVGVISGNDEMALGQREGRRFRRFAGCRGGHQGRGVAVHRPPAGRCLLRGGRQAGRQRHPDGQHRRQERKAALRLPADHQGQHRQVHRSVRSGAVNEEGGVSEAPPSPPETVAGWYNCPFSFHLFALARQSLYEAGMQNSATRVTRDTEDEPGRGPVGPAYQRQPADAPDRAPPHDRRGGDE
jgi:erythritol transport system substrate-binding protein